MKISCNNELLIQLIAKDDENAFAELYNRFWEKLFALSYNRLKDIQSAEDIVHDVFASLWKNRHAVKIDCVENYLATTVKYIILARLKRSGYARQYAVYVRRVTQAEMFTENMVHNRQLLKLVQEEINRLPEKCRLIFKCSREGMTSKQIAESLNISPKTVDNQLYKAVQQLKFRMKHILSSMFYFLF